MQNYDAMELAKREVDKFDPVLHDHAQAMECQDCEADLLKGIKSLAWIERAEDCVIQAEVDCLVDFSMEVHEAIENLYRQWVAKCEPAFEGAKKHQDAGFEVGYLAELTECLLRAKAWLRVQNEIRANTLSHEELTHYAQNVCNTPEKLAALSKLPLHED